MSGRDATILEKKDDDDEEVFLEDDETKQEPLTEEGIVEYLEQYPQILRPVIIGYIGDVRGTVYDKTKVTGVNYNVHTSEMILGNKQLDFNAKGDIVVDSTNIFPGTDGLYELLFKKDPDPNAYSKEDARTYVDLLHATNALYRGNDSDNQLQGVRSDKYKFIIKPILNKERKRKRTLSEGRQKLLDAVEQAGVLNRSKSWTEPYFPPTSYTATTGSGFDGKLTVENKPYRYMYWDDPNELIDRLGLLLASRRAGNTSHENEIASIEEELREADIIY